jgi:hypothetical protein
MPTDRDTLYRAWATHLDSCEDPTCATCAAFDSALYPTR